MSGDRVFVIAILVFIFIVLIATEQRPTVVPLGAVPPPVPDICRGC
jgi:hypothetical protein